MGSLPAGGSLSPALSDPPVEKPAQRLPLGPQAPWAFLGGRAAPAQGPRHQGIQPQLSQPSSSGPGRSKGSELFPSPWKQSKRLCAGRHQPWDMEGGLQALVQWSCCPPPAFWGFQPPGHCRAPQAPRSPAPGLRQVWGRGSPAPPRSPCGVTWLCKAQAHPCLGEIWNGASRGASPGLGTGLRSLGVRVEPPPARPHREKAAWWVPRESPLGSHFYPKTTEHMTTGWAQRLPEPLAQGPHRQCGCLERARGGLHGSSGSAGGAQGLEWGSETLGQPRIKGASLSHQTEGQRGGLGSRHLTSALAGPRRAAPHRGLPRLAHRLGAASHPGCHSEDRRRPPSLPPWGGPGVSAAKGPVGGRSPRESQTGGPGRTREIVSVWCAWQSGRGWGVPVGVTPSSQTRTGRGGPGAEAVWARGPGLPTPRGGPILAHTATSSGRIGSGSLTPGCRKHCPLTQSLRPDTPHKTPRSRDQTDPLEPGWWGRTVLRRTLWPLSPTTSFRLCPGHRMGSSFHSRVGGGGQRLGVYSMVRAGGAGWLRPSSRSQQEGTAHAAAGELQVRHQAALPGKGRSLEKEWRPRYCMGAGQTDKPGHLSVGPSLSRGRDPRT